MPADYSEYVDLTPHDLSPTDIYLGAIQLGRLVLPEFEIRQGTPDDAMLQAFSYMTALNVGAINRLPDRLMQGLCAMMGVTRDGGTKATFTATIALNDYGGIELPAGTVFTHTSRTIAGELSISYENAEPFSIESVSDTDENGDPAAFPYGTIELTSTFTGLNPFVGSTDTLQIETVVPEISSISANNDFVNGSYPEEAEVFLNRATTYLQSLSSNLATAEQIQAHILSTFQSVDRCKVYDQTNYLTDFSIAGPAVPGHAAIFLYGVEAALSNAQLYDVLVGVSNKSTAGIQFTTNNFNVINVGVTVSVARDSAYQETEIVDAVEIAIVDFLSPNGFTSKAEAVKITELQSLIAGVTGVEYVISTTLQDPDNLLGAANPIISGGGSSDIVFLNKGILPSASESNINITTVAV